MVWYTLTLSVHRSFTLNIYVNPVQALQVIHELLECCIIELAVCQTSEQKDLCRVLYSADLLCTTCVRIAQYMMLKAGYITFYR